MEWVEISRVEVESLVSISKSNGVDMSVKLENPEEVVNYFKKTGNFARVCYDSKGDAEKIGRYCVESGHLAPSRAMYFIFNVKNMARIITQQVCRHTVGVEFAQRSQRYCDESEPAFFIPNSIKNNGEALEAFLDAMRVSYSTYIHLKSLRISGDDARMVLPNAVSSDFNIALSPQALIHFCHERLCSRASWQIRALAFAMASQVIALEPGFKEVLVPKCRYLGWCPEKQSCGAKPSKEDALK